MSVNELEKRVRSLNSEQLECFGRWFDTYRQELQPVAGAVEGEEEISQAQEREIMRRRAAYLANPSIATPWAGTPERLLNQLRERRRQKDPASRG